MPSATWATPSGCWQWKTLQLVCSAARRKAAVGAGASPTAASSSICCRRASTSARAADTCAAHVWNRHADVCISFVSVIGMVV